MDNYDDDEDFFDEGLYDSGYWVWSHVKGGLEFISDKPEEDEESIVPAALFAGPTMFHDDMDPLEQIRYRKRMARRDEGDNDTVLLQDIKDFVLYTAPVAILSRALIMVFHMSGAERFLRSLIMYCQYYMQVQELLEKRNFEGLYKIRTENSDQIENDLKDNLQDLRLLLVREYSSFLIEREINRLFKSDFFNISEHKKTKNCRDLEPNDQKILRGDVKHQRHLVTNSPLIDEFTSTTREIDYRILGLGEIKFQSLDGRLRYLEAVLTTPEPLFEEYRIPLGIVGLKRKKFDTCLRPVKYVPSAGSATSTGSVRRLRMLGSKHRSVMGSKPSRMSTASGRMSTASQKSVPVIKTIPQLVLPEKLHIPIVLDEHFPEEVQKSLVICEVQRKKWMTRIKNLLRKKRASSRSRSPAKKTRSNSKGPRPSTVRIHTW